MAQSTKAQASQDAATGTPPSVGYFLLPRQLRRDCQLVGINTLKLVLFIADATLGWDFSRWATLTYATIVADTGIPNDACVRRAIGEAMAASPIEVQTTSAGTLYAILGAISSSPGYNRNGSSISGCLTTRRLIRSMGDRLLSV